MGGGPNDRNKKEARSPHTGRGQSFYPSVLGGSLPRISGAITILQLRWHLRAEHPASAEFKSFLHASMDVLNMYGAKIGPMYVVGVNMLLLLSLQMRFCGRCFLTIQNIYQKTTQEQLISQSHGKSRTKASIWPLDSPFVCPCRLCYIGCSVL